MAENKKLVEAQIWRRDRSSVEVTGRFLGMITNRQLALMLKDRSFSKRLSTVATMPLKEFSDLKTKEVTDNRLLFAAKEIDAVEVKSPILFVTDRIDFVSLANKNDVTVNCKNSGYIIMQEVD